MSQDEGFQIEFHKRRDKTVRAEVKRRGAHLWLSPPCADTASARKKAEEWIANFAEYLSIVRPSRGRP